MKKTRKHYKEKRKTDKKNIKKGKAGILKKVILVILILVLIACLCYIVYYFYSSYKEMQTQKDILLNVEVDETQVTEEKTERMLQLEELQKENSEIIGWLEIEGTNINYPVCQSVDNDYYLTHNYKKEYAKTGALFLDKDFDLVNGSLNYLIYGHRNKDGLMFENLIKYEEEEFYNNHKTIKFTTINEDATYEILSVFYSRVYYTNETNVFRYYYFVNAETEQEYDEFVNDAIKSSMYDTGVTASYGEQLLTLSTCAYHTEDGRFVVIAKKQ